MSHSNTLVQQQRDLLQAIFAANTIATQAINTPSINLKHPLNSHALRGLQTYQANAAASAQRSLQTTYPVIAQLIGDETFAHLARDFWANHPPRCGDLAQWGGSLAGFIAQIPALKTEPYLSDVAKAEWALHSAAAAVNQAADLATFALLTTHDADALTLQLAPGTALIHSEFPVASILKAHLYAEPSFEEVGQKLRHSTPEIALVWRQGMRPMVATCTAAEAAFIGQLLTSASLLTALESIELPDSDEVFDFQLWLPQSVNCGLVLSVTDL